MTEPGHRSADEEAERGELRRQRAEVCDPRARGRVHPLISQAQGIVRERYRLADADSAFVLLQRASQRFDVKIRTLADFLVSLPGPDPREPLWFPRRLRQPEPDLRFEPAHQPDTRNRGGVLGAVLSQTLSVVGTGMGNVQVSERAGRGLVLEKHTGLPPGFVEFFDHVGHAGTSCGPAARQVTQVTVRDVETDPVFTEPARAAILAAGSRACHSVPLTTASGLCVGMVSAHLDRTFDGPTRAQLKALDVVGADGGRWLAWHAGTVVLDALEHLHGVGRRMRGTRLRRQ
ncbi:ANTAR domain-containing protein [Streptomyces sp. NPDC101225]|uniref:ANTAR domain-containing protein n=1 Tax=Streptomyces sp. NPDC101225 TaxID=3366135 RepID=UPI0037FE40AD